MPNPNPNQSGLRNFRPQGKPKEAIAPKPSNTKHYLRVWEVLQTLPEPAAYIRDAVLEKMIRDGLLEP